jgi:hypothetical protein
MWENIEITEENILSVIALTVSIFTLIVTIFRVIIPYIYSRRNEYLSNQQRNDLALQEYIFDVYLERHIKATTPPKIGNKIITLLNEAKTYAFSELKKHPEEWKLKSRFISSKDTKFTWQNKVAFETAWTLQHMGIAALYGIIPLNVFLPTMSERFMIDWLICYDWVTSFRDNTGNIGKNNRKLVVHYYRRHAEWLALVSTAYAYKNWDSPNATFVIDKYGDISQVKLVVKNISKIDKNFMPNQVRRDLRKLIGLRV